MTGPILGGVTARLVIRALAEWDEAKHPRDGKGRFLRKGGLARKLFKIADEVAGAARYRKGDRVTVRSTGRRGRVSRTPFIDSALVSVEFDGGGSDEVFPHNLERAGPRLQVKGAVVTELPVLGSKADRARIEAAGGTRVDEPHVLHQDDDHEHDVKVGPGYEFKLGDGTRLFVEDGGADPVDARVTIGADLKNLGDMPAAWRARLERVEVLAGPDPMNEELTRKFGQRGRIAGVSLLRDSPSSPAGTMAFFDGEINDTTFDHEFGHFVDEWQGRYSMSDEYGAAAASDAGTSSEWLLEHEHVSASYDSGLVNPPTPGLPGVTEYGSSSRIEDWAEAFSLYRAGERGERMLTLHPGTVRPTPVTFRELWPARASYFDKLMAAAARAKPPPALNPRLKRQRKAAARRKRPKAPAAT